MSKAAASRGRGMAVSSLNSRLMAGLLAVTACGLLLMGLTSAVVLRGYLMHRVDRQLTAARERPLLVRVGDAAGPARYIILNVGPGGDVRAVSGDDPDPTEAIGEVRRLGIVALRDKADRGTPFGLGSMRAAARRARNRVIVVVAPLSDVHAAVFGLAVIELITGAMLLALLALLGRWLIHRGLAPLSRMAVTARRIASGGDLRARMEETSSAEVGRLAGAINFMLDRIEQAFVARIRSEAKVREFAADASHELRTPLTTIKGYAELHERGAVDAGEAMRRIAGEAERMRLLVEELLELARLDRGSALSLGDVDLAELAREAVADAAAVEPDRPLTLEAPASLTAVADEARIRRILANLLANVRSHTPPRTPATVRLATASGAMVLEVADDGPGMEPEEAGRAFDRFHHASGDGSGLGLAIVAAITAAHGGRAMLRSAPGRGTTVRVELPQAKLGADSEAGVETPST